MSIGYINQNGVITQQSTSTGKIKIDEITFDDAGAAPTENSYAISIGGENYYIHTIDMEQNEVVVFKTIVPTTYNVGSSIRLRIFYSSAGTSVNYTYSCFVSLLKTNNILDASLSTFSNEDFTITSSSTANEFKSTTVTLSNVGKIGGSLIEGGDILVGKLVRKDADVNDFRLIMLELNW